jgi:hypothetical protein
MPLPQKAPPEEERGKALVDFIENFRKTTDLKELDMDGFLKDLRDQRKPIVRPS